MYFYQEIKVLLIFGKLKNFFVEKMCIFGIVVCLLYYIVFVIGGMFVEINLKIVKLVSVYYYDELLMEGNEYGQVFCDVQLEQELLEEVQKFGFGVQFGGKYFVYDICVICLLCYGVFCLVGMGVFCFVDCNIKVKINCEGIWIEKLEYNSGQYIL